MSTCKKCQESDKVKDYFYDEHTFGVCKKCGTAYINPKQAQKEQHDHFQFWINKARSLVSKTK